VVAASVPGNWIELVARASDPDPVVREAALYTIASLARQALTDHSADPDGPTRARSAATAALADTRPSVRAAAAFALERLQLSVPADLQSFDDTLEGALAGERDPDVRRVLIGALGRAGTQATAEALATLVATPVEPGDAAAAAAALAALAGRGHWGAEARVALVAGLRSRDSAVRASAARGLAVSDAPDLWIRHRNEIRDALVDWGVDEPATRFLLAGFGRLLLRSQLEPWTRAPADPRVRLAAVQALASHSDGVSTVPALAAALGDPHPWVRSVAADALARYPTTTAAVEALATFDAPANPPSPPSPAAFPGPADPISWNDADRAALAALGARPRLRLVMDDETRIEIELVPTRAPATVLHLVRRVESGAYDGVPAHRVVPGALVQIGHTERIGNAPPPELTPTPMERARVGWAASGTDGDDDLFIALDDLPELTGAHTVFGTVVEGLATLETLSPGRHIARASIVLD
jgi:cyclophilin family peptidyl-prolyl cis-trans isomerase/HEAT repeat protein